MRTRPRAFGTLGVVALATVMLAAAPSSAQTVKITPLGSHAGELCANDRALLFEDPTGVRILYDAGRTIAGGTDPRLGAVHAVLLSHAHGDHIGDTKAPGPDAGTCDRPATVSAAPHSNTAEIAAAKSSAIVVSNDMGAFSGQKGPEHPRLRDAGLPDGGAGARDDGAAAGAVRGQSPARG
jgi:hypothetical protein